MYVVGHLGFVPRPGDAAELSALVRDLETLLNSVVGNLLVHAEQPENDESGFGVASRALSTASSVIRILSSDDRLNVGAAGAQLTQDETIELDGSFVCWGEGRTAAAGVSGPCECVDEPLRTVSREVQLSEAAGMDPALIRSVRGPCRAPSRHQIERLRALKRGYSADTAGAIVIVSSQDVASYAASGGPLGRSPGRVGPAAVPGAACWATEGEGAVSSGQGAKMLLPPLCYAIGTSEMTLPRGTAVLQARCAGDDVIVRARVSGGILPVFVLCFPSGLALQRVVVDDSEWRINPDGDICFPNELKLAMDF